jgi:hypothetical protein
MQNFINKDLFISVIEGIREQYEIDKLYAESVSVLLRAEDCKLYDNSKYLEVIMSMLRVSFPKDVNGFCEIEHYCFQLNFGKVGEEYESPFELYDRLCAELFYKEAKKTHWISRQQKAVESYNYVVSAEQLKRLESFLGEKVNVGNSETTQELHNNFIDAYKREAKIKYYTSDKFKKGLKELCDIIEAESINGEHLNFKK